MKKRTTTNKIVLHCSATPEGKDYKAADINKWHKNQGWECIGYHYVIDIDGTIEKGRPEEMIGAHVSGHNSDSIGICYIGGCDKNMKAKDTRTEQQKQSMYKLVKELLEKYKLPSTQVYTHNVLCGFKKACPSFKLEVFRKEYDDWIKTEVSMELQCNRNKKQQKNICPYCGHEL